MPTCTLTFIQAKIGTTADLLMQKEQETLGDLLTASSAGGLCVVGYARAKCITSSVTKLCAVTWAVDRLGKTELTITVLLGSFERRSDDGADGGEKKRSKLSK